MNIDEIFSCNLELLETEFYLNEYIETTEMSVSFDLKIMKTYF